MAKLDDRKNLGAAEVQKQEGGYETTGRKLDTRSLSVVLKGAESTSKIKNEWCALNMVVKRCWTHLPVGLH